MVSHSTSLSKGEPRKRRLVTRFEGRNTPSSVLECKHTEAHLETPSSSTHHSSVNRPGVAANSFASVHIARQLCCTSAALAKLQLRLCSPLPALPTLSQLVSPAHHLTDSRSRLPLERDGARSVDVESSCSKGVGTLPGSSASLPVSLSYRGTEEGEGPGTDLVDGFGVADER